VTTAEEAAAARQLLQQRKKVHAFFAVLRAVRKQMSGRLVILPKKSWNVWNRDNREKVLRDERLEREKEEAERNGERDRLHEQTLAALIVRSAKQHVSEAKEAEEEDQPEGKGGGADTEGGIVEPFRLFGDLEDQARKKTYNEEHKKEKEKLEMQAKTRDGTAPWALSEGSAVKPWYSSAPLSARAAASKSKKMLVRGVWIEGEEAAVARDRDEQRKCEVDPMAALLKFRRPPHTTSATTTSSSSSSSALCVIKSEFEKKAQKEEEKEVEQKQKRPREDISDDSDEKHHKKKKKKEKKEKRKEKKSSREKKRDEEKREKELLMLELRQKRLMREKEEKRKASLLLHDFGVYGAAGSSGGGGGRFNSMFNPALAK